MMNSYPHTVRFLMCPILLMICSLHYPQILSWELVIALTKACVALGFLAAYKPLGRLAAVCSDAMRMSRNAVNVHGVSALVLVYAHISYGRPLASPSRASPLSSSLSS